MLIAACCVAACLQSETFSRPAFEKHVRTLADDDLAGRDNNTGGGRRAAQYVADRFKEYGLKGGGRNGYFHDFKAAVGEKFLEGRNVIGLLEGERAKEYVVVAAHHDARGVVKEKIQNGADDNASGVAMVLELARAMASSKPKRSMLFISFDCEEDGLLGSREFVKEALYDTGSIVAVFVFDLIGGDFFDWEKRRLYALGSECSEALHERVGKKAREAKDLDVARAGIYLIEPVPGMARSDYKAFRDREVPFVFFSTGTPWYYHTEHDDVDRINFDKMTAAARFLHGLISETAAAETRPAWRAPAPREEDARWVKDGLAKILENADRLKLDEKQRRSVRLSMEQIEEASKPDAEKLQKAMILILSIARRRP